MSALLRNSALSGHRAFTLGKPKAPKISNGSRVFMRKKDSYLIEIQVGEEEAEDSAIRKYMNAVLNTRVLDELRARRRMETKVEKRKRETRERIAARKMGIVEPTWEEVYGLDTERKVYDEFFLQGEPGDGFDNMWFSDNMLQPGFGQDDDIFSGLPYGQTEWNGTSSWGQYVEPNSNRNDGGYIGGYGGYMS